MKPVAWIRKWKFDGEEPRKEKRENGRLAWPTKFKLLPVTTNKCSDDDVPLYAADQLRAAQVAVLREAANKLTKQESFVQAGELMIMADEIEKVKP